MKGARVAHVRGVGRAGDDDFTAFFHAGDQKVGVSERHGRIVFAPDCQHRRGDLTERLCRMTGSPRAPRPRTRQCGQARRSPAAVRNGRSSTATPGPASRASTGRARPAARCAARHGMARTCRNLGGRRRRRGILRRKRLERADLFPGFGSEAGAVQEQHRAALLGAFDQVVNPPAFDLDPPRLMFDHGSDSPADRCYSILAGEDLPDVTRDPSTISTNRGGRSGIRIDPEPDGAPAF